MGFDADPTPDDRLDLAQTAEFSLGEISELRPGEAKRKVEREAGVLANHQAGKEKARVVEEDDAMKWECTLVIAEAGKIWLKTLTLLTLPQVEDQYIAFMLEGYAARVLYEAQAIRTMELHPV